MHTKGYSNIPSELFYYITFLTRALPLRSAKTFIEFKRPWQGKGRGRPGKYGTRYTKEEIKRLPLNKETVHLYGREQQVN